jgi:hypothetical protein
MKKYATLKSSASERKARTKRLESAQTFEDLVAVALDDIAKLGRPRGMVCGPLTSGGLGNFKTNIDAMQERIDVLKAEGLIIFEQTAYEDDLQRIKKNYDPRTVESTLLETFYGTIFGRGEIDIW